MQKGYVDPNLGCNLSSYTYICIQVTPSSNVRIWDASREEMAVKILNQSIEKQ
jgi:hypothetical protein